MRSDPKRYDHRPLGRKVGLAELDFGVLERDSLCDSIGATPLTEAERAAPMAWLPLSEHLIEWDFEKAMGLAEIGAAVSAENWGDDEIPVPFQEIARCYLHAAGAGHEMWVSVEFKPWVRFLEGVDDDDADGFPELYARLPAEAVTEEIVKELNGAYRAEVLTAEKLGTWFYELGNLWYPKYNTETLDDARRKAWPDEKARAALGEGLSWLGGERPTVVIEGRPFGADLWNVFFIGSPEEMR
jgi:hypothetical protein